MKYLKKYIGDLYLPSRFYFACGISILLFICSFLLPVLFLLAEIGLIALLTLVAADYLFLFVLGRQPSVKRSMSDRLSNGDDNPVLLRIKNRMNYPVNLEVIEEMPEQLQIRNMTFKRVLSSGQSCNIEYKLKPLERGQYDFGDTNLYISSLLGLLARRFTAPTAITVPVYPSYIQLKKQQLVSMTAMLKEHGGRRIRKVGQSMEFEQIKEYVTGDDVRTLNWKATARKGSLMINRFADEKSQQVYCIIDKGRLMKMPFNGLTLLDYAINSTLVMSHVCLQKQDRVGLITFAEKMGTVIAADRKPVQREHILEALYRQQTAFLESDYEMLYMQLRRRVKQRSLIILYTNFESLYGLYRQLHYLRSIARHHLLLVVFFENTELVSLAHADALNLEDVYVKTTADKFVFEKKLIVKELQKHGILSVLTAPEKLTVNTVNKYLELKLKQAI